MDEQLILCGQYIVARKQDGSPYLARLEPIQDIFKPVEWQAAKQQIEAKGMQFLGVVHAFQTMRRANSPP